MGEQQQTSLHQRKNIVALCYIFTPYDGIKNDEHRMCVQVLYVCVCAHMCATHWGGHTARYLGCMNFSMAN